MLEGFAGVCRHCGADRELFAHSFAERGVLHRLLSGQGGGQGVRPFPSPGSVLEGMGQAVGICISFLVFFFMLVVIATALMILAGGWGLMRHWALTICVACILVGALELLLPRQESFKSIKTVLALYILLSVLSPVKQVDWSGLAGAAQTAAAQPADYSAYVDGYARSELKPSCAKAWQGRELRVMCRSAGRKTGFP